MDKFLTIEVDRESKYPVKVGHLCAKDIPDAYDQMKPAITGPAYEGGEALVIKATEVNQLIIDLNKMARKI